MIGGYIFFFTESFVFGVKKQKKIKSVYISAYFGKCDFRIHKQNKLA